MYRVTTSMGGGGELERECSKNPSQSKQGSHVPLCIKFYSMKYKSAKYTARNSCVALYKEYAA
jgi:hypothetical protein